MPPHGDDDDPHLFSGVRFALVGFDHVSRSQYRVEMQRAGGTDAGDWHGDCTHVIVHGLLYDDPVCVAARKDGKKVVTEQWVEDSLDLGELADADRVLYWPVRDFSGIPGSESLIICLTGYHKDMRQDIMKMVSLMGAEFSKSLASNQVTHLICYKFEGEKYEVAKFVNIKIVNHRWLEDCLKAWEILPIDDYRRSGWEIEIMETQVKDSEDETEDVGTGSSRNRRISRSTSVRVDSDVNSPTPAPTIPSASVEGAAGRDSGNTTNTNGVTISVGIAADPSVNDEGPANQVTRDEVGGDHNRAPEVRSTALCTPGIHKSIATPIQVDKIENTDANCFQNSNGAAANKVCWPNPSEEKLSRTILLPPDLSRKVDQKDDGQTPDLKSIVCQPDVEEKQKLRKSNVVSEGNSSLWNSRTHILTYSRRCASKKVSPDTNLRSEQQITSPQSSKGKISSLELSTPTRKLDQDSGEPADAPKLQEAEAPKHVDRSSSALVQRRKSILSSVNPGTPNCYPGSRAGELSSLISNKESASEGSNVSDLERNSAEGIEVDGRLSSGPTVSFTDKQISGSFKSNLLSYRRSNLKLASSGQTKRHSETSFDGKNMGAFGEVKAPALHAAEADKDCAICPPVNSEVRKESSGVSHQNENTEMIDVELVNKVNPPSSYPDMAVPNQILEAGPEDISFNAIIGQESKGPAKVSTSKVKNASAKRSRDAGSKTAAVIVELKLKVSASDPMHDKAVSCQIAETNRGEKCSSPNTDEPAPLFPIELMNGKSKDEASKAEPANMFLHKNMKEDNKKLSSSANADVNIEKSCQKVPDSTSRNSAAGVPRTVDGNMNDSPTAEKTETMSLKPNFIVVVTPEDRETYLKNLSGSVSADDPETCTSNKVPNDRMRKVVAKRKMSAVQKQKFVSEPCKTAGVFVTEDIAVSSERVAQSSRSPGKETVDQDVQKSNGDKKDDPVESFCKSTMEDRSKGTQLCKSRSKKRQKTVTAVDGYLDHDKENMPVHCNFTSKTKYGNNSISSNSIAKVLPNGKAVPDENIMIRRNDSGTLNVLEPTWFILSGHRLLRKEYKSILTRLRGRVCRDSHHWSFQATHLVATELRRTEKFFAAAAAGRWILKPDYLTACMEAGKFLGEEPFEWHGHGLNNSENISLDAPRKWRQHKQRTGHGAFYGMQIIIYGECIAPTLDTLKRVIRAGDGTILATSPPYTRCFKSNVDFAVVSEGMPSVDAWVQEFVRHKIPCISADYLVEYVCKPGHSLTKHVLFDMYDLAEKSLEKLLKSQHDDVATGEVTEANMVCTTCRSNDRDRPMLICGSDGNSAAGCGVVVHVDCGNPPVEAAGPAGEWLCTKCDESKPAKKAKKNAAKSRVLKCR